MCMVLGSPGVGKTLLLKRLNACSNRGNYNDVGEAPSTIPTVGTNLVNMVAGRKGEITLRELGGCMAPIWHNYYKDCQALIFMIDLSNRVQVSASCILLMEVLVNEYLKAVPILILLNKVDMPGTMKRLEFDYIMRLKDTLQHTPQRVKVLEISAYEGTGLQDVSKWIQEHAH